MNTKTMRRDCVGNLGMCCLALVTMPFVVNPVTDDLEKHQTYFQKHMLWSLALIAVPAVLHFLVQSAIHESMWKSREGSRLVRSLRPACIFTVGFVAGLAEVAVADLLFVVSSR